MFVLGLVKSLVPFFMTLTLGVFIASFFVVLPSPKVEVKVERSWNSSSSRSYRSYCRKKREMRRMEKKIRRLKTKARHLKRKDHRRRMNESKHHGLRVIEMVEVPLPPRAPIASKK